jgi:hypothetical protein
VDLETGASVFTSKNSKGHTTSGFGSIAVVGDENVSTNFRMGSIVFLFIWNSWN